MTENRIKTIQASLEMEGNTLSVDQVTTLLENKPVVAPQKDIQEVRNAIETYNQINEFDPYSINSLRYAHRLLLKGLVDNSGELRTTSVGIAKGDEVQDINFTVSRIQTILCWDLAIDLTLNETTKTNCQDCSVRYKLSIMLTHGNNWHINNGETV